MKILLTDRTRTTTDWKCPQARYWLTEHDGTGIVPVEASEALELGTLVHAAIPRLIAGEDPVTVAKETAKITHDLLVEVRDNALIPWGSDPPENQWSRWVEGVVYGLGRIIIPAMLDEWEILSVEEEMTRDVPSPFMQEDLVVRLMIKADVLMQHKQTRVKRYREWKTTAYRDDKWIRQWSKNVQLMGTMKLLEVPVSEVMGIFKSYIKEGRLLHPFAWAYTVSGVVDTKWRADYAKGWHLTESDQWPGGVTSWIDHLLEESPDVVQGSFILTPEIYINERLASKYLRQLWLREQEIDYTHTLRDEHGALPQLVMDRIFPQHFDQCEPVKGYPCSYLKACWAADHGGASYEPRTPHHETEQRGMEE